MQEQFSKAKQLIEKSRRILLTMHERMDGDDGGSILALASHLESTGKTVTCVVKGGVPPALSFLPGSRKIKNEVQKIDSDLLIICGCSTKDRCGIKEILDSDIPVLNIDHHPDNANFGQANIVDAKKSSVAELVYDFFKWCKWPINKDIATCLLTGIVTDTGAFMHNNTTASALKAAADLMKKGAPTSRIIQLTFKQKPLSALKAWGKAMENSYYDKKHRIIYSIVTEKDLKELDDVQPGAFEGFASILSAVPEAKFALFLRQEGETIKGSLRSEPFKNVDVAKIAKLFGGGGHKLAAGFSVAGKLEKDEHGKWKVV